MKLVVPSAEYQESYIQMVREFSDRGEAFVPFVLAEDYDDFSSKHEFFSTSDVVSLHLRLNEATRASVTADDLRQ